MTGPADPTAPLAGLRVLDMTRLFPGAYCTNLLADLGADILKVEAPGFGDGLRFIPEPFLAGHHALNRGKRSMTLNLKSPRAPEILRRLARDADVLIESGRPGSMEKLGMGFDDLRAENPGLIWCSITGFGPDGPNVDAPGHDLTYLGYAGLLAQLSEDEVPPVPPIGLTLQIAGSHAAFGIMAAVHGRDPHRRRHPRRRQHGRLGDLDERRTAHPRRELSRSRVGLGGRAQQLRVQRRALDHVHGKRAACMGAGRRGARAPRARRPQARR